MADDPTIVALGDSAMWTSGTAYQYKTPNLVNKELTGDPIPPVQFRARGGATIGKDAGSTTADGSFDPEDDQYIHKYDSEFQTLNQEANNQSDVDAKNINELKWSIVRDIGDGHPTVLEQIDQFAPGSGSLSVPWDGTQPIRLYDAGGNSFLREPETTPPDAEDVDIVLLNGGTNDIGLDWLMDFTQHSYYEVMEEIEKYCYRHQKHLLEKARDRFPNALLVLVGYPVFLSEWTWYPKGKQYLQAFLWDMAKQLVGRVPTHVLIERVVDGAMVFARSHHHYMRKAVAERSHVEARQGHPGVMYVSRGFGTINAFEGPDPWAWGQSNDDTYDRRKHFVLDLVQPTKAGLPALKPKMLSAAIGHPNRKGSRQTADAIVDRYRDRNSLAVGETAEKLDQSSNSSSGKRSLKDALSSRKLFPNSFNTSGKGSVRHALSHRYVDSIQVKFHVAPTLKHANWWQSSWRTNHLHADCDVYLQIRPGRSGGIESFRLDYESDEEARDTPQFDRHLNNSGEDWWEPNWYDEWLLDRDGNPDNGRLVTEVNIDPMADRQMYGGVHTNNGKSRSQKEDNVRDESQGWDITWNSTSHGGTKYGIPRNDIPNDRQDFLPQNRWDTDRLMLSQIDEARIRVINPGFWALRKVELTINGELTWTKRRTAHGDLEKTFKKATRNGWYDVEFDMLS